MNKVIEYYNTKAISNSLLKVIEHNPKLFWLKQQGLVEDEDSTYLRIGSAVDCLLTQPENWDLEFIVMQNERPYGLMRNFVEELPPGLNIASGYEEYEEAYKKSGYKVSIDRVVNWFWGNTQALTYYQEKHNNKDDKIVLDKTEHEIVQNAISLIQENPYTLWYFKGEEPQIERLLQLPIYFDINGVDCKALLDGVVIDHEKKIIKPFDLKTSSKGVFNFENSFVNYGYYRQAAMYRIALEHYIKLAYNNLDTYKVENFRFIVVDSKAGATSPALIYNTSLNDLHVGLYGGKIKNSNTKVKGIYQLLEDYLWHVKEDKWLLTRDLYESLGEADLNVFKKYEQSAKK